MNYLDILETYKEEMMETLRESVSYPSVLAQPVRTVDGEVLPFGRATHDAYMHMLKLGGDMGFETLNVDNYGGHIEFPAAAENGSVVDHPETFGILAHLDVMPEGAGWTRTEPFKMAEEDGYLYGRGVIDDKGPTVACLYAMKALKEAGIQPKMNIRMVLGLDEETGKSGMKYYLDKVPAPDMGITPDAGFPAVLGEMGIIIFEMAQKMNRQATKEGLRLTKLDGGDAPNVVPRTCKAVIAGSAEAYESIKEAVSTYAKMTDYNIKARKQGSSLVIEAVGQAAHGAHPHLGLNAISIMMGFLGGLQFSNDEVNDFIDFYNQHIGFDLHGERMGCGFRDEESGKLIWNVGMAHIDEDFAQMTINIRYPVTVTGEQVYEGINRTIENTRLGIVKNLMHETPIYLEPDHPMVKKLIDTYREHTGDLDSKPYTMGIGTYAKLVKNALAYGGQMPGERNTMHQADEELKVSTFYEMARIYAKALYAVCCE